MHVSQMIHWAAQFPPTFLWELDKVELLALFGPGDVTWQEWVHEGLKVGSPPLCQSVANIPVLINTLA